jgi:acetoacetyl-CoA synthetase
MSQAPRVLWTPDPEAAGKSQMAALRDWLRTSQRLDLPAGYDALWRWSIHAPDRFWGSIAEFFDVRFHQRPDAVLGETAMPGAQWFPGATLNYAEHSLTLREGKSPDDLAVIFVREDGLEERLTYGALRRAVAAAQAGLHRIGVRRGDRVVALLPNCPQALIAFLATASLGAIWSSCSPDFGARAVADRFVQIEPVVLIAVDGYHYGGRTFDIRSTVDGLRAQLPSLRATVLVPYLHAGALLPGATQWSELMSATSGVSATAGTAGVSATAGVSGVSATSASAGDEPTFEPVPFEHPLWVLYSSGTTGLPKGIVHGHGGIVLEHLKVLALHSDLRPGERLFWFTTTGWMMWNYLISGLLVGATIVLYDGSPAHPDLTVLWRLAERLGINYFGTSAPYVQSCLKDGLRPRDHFDLSGLRAIGSTGAPLSPEGFDWIVDAVGPHIQTCSVSGGTDLCTAFVGAAPDVPVWQGEISCRMLGAAVAAYDEVGNELIDEVGELVLTKPMPSMPVFFWNDPDGSRLREAYFDRYPGVWRHGDWLRVTPRGSCVIYGRSDSTLNRGGVRMGTSEFYRVVEGFDEVLDSLVIDTSGAGGAEGELLCFLVLAPGVQVADLQPRLRTALRTELSPRHVPDRFFAVSDIPRTLNGKKCEVPVKKILTGVAPGRAVSAEALRNPAALDVFVQLAAARL